MKEVLLWALLWAAVIILTVISLPGCTSWNSFQSGVAIQGAKVADEALETSEWGVCELPTMGAWQRRYGENPEKARAWAELCGVTLTVPALAP